MLRLHSHFNRLLRNQSGGVAVLFGLASAVLFTLAALVIDGGQLFVTKTKLQGTADAAALAGALDLPNQGAAHAASLIYAMNNMPPNEYGQVLRTSDISFGVWDEHDKAFTAGAVPADAVRVIVRRSESNNNPVETHFAHLIGFGEVDVEASSIATIGNPSVCILALEPHSSHAMDLGNGTIDAEGCVVQVNSEHPTDAITGNPNGSVTAEAVCAFGGHDSKPSYSPAPNYTCPPLNDPLSYLEDPEVGSCDHNGASVSSGNATFDPGVYCGGIDITTNGTITFNPGLYVIKNGEFKAGGGATLIGQGVSFFLTGSDA